MEDCHSFYKEKESKRHGREKTEGIPLLAQAIQLNLLGPEKAIQLKVLFENPVIKK